MAISLGVAASAQATIYYVSTTGSDSNAGTSVGTAWRTIQHAANTMVAGDTLYIESGTYNENINIGTSGTAGNPITYRPDPLAAANSVIIGNGGVVSNAGPRFKQTISNLQYITIEGLVIADVQGQPAMQFSNGDSNIQILNNTLQNITGNNAFAIQFYNYSGCGCSSTNIVISGNTIQNVTSDGTGNPNQIITLGGSITNSQIVNNTFTNVASQAIDVVGGYSWLTGSPSNILVQGNVLSGVSTPNSGGWGAAIYLDGTSNSTVNANSIANTQGWGIEVSDSGDQGTASSNNNLISNNLVYGSLRAGINVGGWNSGYPGQVASSNSILNNTLYNNNTGGGQGEITLERGSNNVFENNIIYAGSSNVFLSFSNSVGSGDTGNSFNYNDWYSSNVANATWGWFGNTYTGLAAWQAGSSQDANAINTDPQFTNAAAANFYLLCTSPARDTGKTEALVPKDYNNTYSRPIGGAYDRGAYEITCGSPTLTPSSTPSITRSATPSGTPTASPSPSFTPSSTPSFTPTRTATPSVSPSATVSNTPSATPSFTASATSSFTASASFSPSATSTCTPSVTHSPTPTFTASPSATPSFSQTPSSTPSFTRTATPTNTATFTQTVTATVTPTATPSATLTITSLNTSTDTPTASPTFSASPSATSSFTRTASSTATPTATPSSSQSSTPTDTPSDTPSVTWTSTPSITPTASPSATPTITSLNTATHTPTSSPSDTITVTFSSTFTLTASPSATPTFTQTSSSTPSITFSNTPSSTPSYTQTSSCTPSATFSNTASTTPSDTQTLTSTPSITFSNTPTVTPSYTQTLTSTPSITFSNTPTATPTFTATPSFTPSYTATPPNTFTATPTDTPTYTATPSYTNTVSPSNTPTNTPSSTATASATPSYTATPSATPSFTRTITPSFTSSPTVTQSYTFTPTPVPMPNSVVITIYNSAGEVVRKLYSGNSQFAPTSLQLSSTSLAEGNGNSIAAKFTGYLSNMSTSIFWDGRNDGGQYVIGGSYVVKEEVIDQFGKITSFSVSLNVVQNSSQQNLSVYNSAGERVADLPVFFLGNTSATDFSLGSTSLALSYQPGNGQTASPFTITLLDSNGNTHTQTWDGHNQQGQPLQPGAYIMQLQTTSSGAGTQVVSHSFSVLSDGSQATQAQVTLAPNPALGGRASVFYSPGPQGSRLVLKLFNLAGEQVAALMDESNSGRLDCNFSRLASGIYVVEAGRWQGQALLARSLNLLAITK